MRLFLGCILLVLVACQEKPETRFERDGISATCPAGWKITEEEAIEEGGYYVSIEKAGMNTSGLINLTWVNGEIDLEEWLDIFKEEFNNNIIYKNSNLTFGEPHSATFNKSECLAIDFSASVLGLKHEGTVRVFYVEDKTVAVVTQQAVEDTEENKEGFDTFETSFQSSVSDSPATDGL